MSVILDGIVGNSGGDVVNSFNCGSITVSGENSNGMVTYVGGIVGEIQYSQLTGCYNRGKIEFLMVDNGGKTTCIGGVCGSLYNSTMQDCYNTGEVTADDAIEVGALIGRYLGSCSYSNLYYISNTTLNGVGNNTADLEGMAKTEDEMKIEEFINLLNTNTPGTFKADENNINEGYPILSWQK